MKSFHHSALMVLFVLVVMLPLESRGANGAPTGEAGDTPTALLISASVGPLHYLSGAKVVVKDAQGKLIGRAVTNIRGVTRVEIRPEQRAMTPFIVQATGGKILDSYTNGIQGPRFQGTLRAQVDTLETGRATLVYLDIISSAASRLVTGKLDYHSAFEKIRSAFGISNRVSPDVFRYQNQHVGWALIESEIKRKRGFNPFIRSLVKKVKQGSRLDFMQPGVVTSNRSLDGPSTSPGTPLSTSSAVMSAASSSSYSPCSSQVGNSSGNGGTSSTELITMVGVEASKGLLSMAGLKALAPGVDIAAGMLLTGGNETSPELEAIEAVSMQLECISAQINYLTQQVAKLLQYQTVQPATACDSTVSTGYSSYEMYVNLAQPNADGTPSAYPLNDSNIPFKQSLDGWGDTIFACGTTINNMLWGTAGGQGSAWQAINSNLQGEYPWWTQQQVQELQEFLAYWSMRLHEAFVLHTEYLNYYGYFSYAKSKAGAYEYSSDLCTSDTRQSTYPNTFCVWQNNILPAYPKDLYSDEVAIPASGLSVHILPGSYNYPSLPTLNNDGSLYDDGVWYPVDAKYLVQTYGRKGEDKKVFATDFVGIADWYENNFTISPENGGSAVETYRNLKERHGMAIRQQVDILNQPGPPGPWQQQAGQYSNVKDFFVSQVYGVPNNPWVPATGLTLYAMEDVSMVTSAFVLSEGSSQGYLFNPRSSVLPSSEFVAAYDCPGDNKNRYNCSYYEPHYVGMLRQRAWWDAMSALTYQPPCPPLPQGQQC